MVSSSARGIEETSSACSQRRTGSGSSVETGFGGDGSKPLRLPDAPYEQEVKMKDILRAILQLDERQRIQHQELSAHAKVQTENLMSIRQSISQITGAENHVPSCLLEVSGTTPAPELLGQLPIPRIDFESSLLGNGDESEEQVFCDSSRIREQQQQRQSDLSKLQSEFRRSWSVCSDTNEDEPPPDWRTQRVAFFRHLAGKILHFKVTCCDGHEFNVFEYLMATIILANAICIGFESNLSLQATHSDELQYFKNLEYVFLFTYYFEIILRFLDGGWKAMRSGMVPFDVMLVALGTISAAFSALVEDGDSATQSTLAVLSPVLVLRVLRLLRLLRALRMVPHFKVLWTLVSGLFNSAGAMFSTVALLALTIYIFSCLAIEIISKDTLLQETSETKEILDNYFCSLDTVMMTFMQFVTMDSIASIYTPLVKHRGYLFFYFAFIIIIISVTLMNLVTAVLVEAAIANTKADDEMAKQRVRRLRPQIYAAFSKMDINNDHILSKEEVLLCHSGLPRALLNVVPQESLSELFDLLDTDNSGEITSDEFVEGVIQFVTSGVSFNTMQELRLLNKIRRVQDDATIELQCIHSRLKHLSQEEQRSRLRSNSQTSVTANFPEQCS